MICKNLSDLRLGHFFVCLAQFFCTDVILQALFCAFLIFQKFGRKNVSKCCRSFEVERLSSTQVNGNVKNSKYFHFY